MENLLLAVFEKWEKENHKIKKILHSDIGMAHSLLQIQLSRHLKDKISSEAYELMTGLVNEANDKCRIISSDLSPHYLESLGIFPSIKIYNTKVTEVSQLTINFKNTSGLINISGLPLHNQLHIYRLYGNILNYFFEFLYFREINVNCFMLQGILCFDFIGVVKDKLVEETNTATREQESLARKVIEARLLANNFTLGEISDWKSKVRIEIPYSI